MSVDHTRPVPGPRHIVAAVLLAAAVARPSLDANANVAAQNPSRPSAVSGAPVWPLPPAEPRIRYVTSYRGIDDFQTKKPAPWKRMILGPEEQADHSADMMIKPYSIAVSPDGRVYVTDTAARRVFVFDAESKTVSFVGGTGQGKLAKPVGVAVDADGKVFVSDATSRRVFVYDPRGALVMAIGQDGEFENPAGLAIDRGARRLYVADTAKHQVRCYSTADGAFEHAIGQRGTAPGAFNFPTNLSVDRLGRLYVTDTMNFRIQVFDPQAKLLTAFGQQGDTPGTLNRPKGVGVDSEGHIYVADSSFNNYQVFDEAGRLLLIVGSGGNAPGEFMLPAGLYVDASNRIYVADQGNSRVQVFQYLRGRTGPPTRGAPR